MATCYSSLTPFGTIDIAPYMLAIVRFLAECRKRLDIQGSFCRTLISHIIIIIIIIITNEKIKVMLSRKRCRGTLQDYNKCQSKLWTNRNVFSWCLNGMREDTVRRDGGRLFHARGAATGKARSPRVDLCTGGTTSVVVVDDRR